MSMSHDLAKLLKVERRTDLPDFRVGDTVRAYIKVVEGGKERVQAFEGVVIRMNKPRTIEGTFTLRRIAHGVGVERTLPINSPRLERVEVVRRGRVRRARLYYLRGLTGKAARIKERRVQKAPAGSAAAT